VAETFNLADQPWRAIRPELTSGVSGKLLLDGALKIVLTRVAPGGEFRAHRDSYGHLFHVLSGRGVATVEDRQYPLVEGIVVNVAAGELHGYGNCYEEDLVLISVNLLPVSSTDSVKCLTSKS